MKLSPYKQRVLEHLEDWVNGVCNHNVVDNECLPDFSCCHPNLYQEDREKRVCQLNYFKERNGLNRHLDA